MPDARPILILAASTGAGHLVAAKAIEEALREIAPNIPVETHDILTHTNRLFRAFCAGGYLTLVRRFPAGMGILYDSTDRPIPSRWPTWNATWLKMNAGGANRFLLRARPRLIINTHFVPAEIVANLRKAGRIDCPQATITTDFETHAAWVQPPTERYYVATELGAAYLRICGVTPESIRVTGIPVRSAFAAPLSRESARATLSIRDPRPLVLLLSGGFGVGPTEKLLADLLSLRGRAQFAVICGKNARLEARLTQRFSSANAELQIVGFSDQIAQWMRAADVVVTKPGGLTTAEALACGAPLVIANPIPGPESRNSDYLLEHGVAIKANREQLVSHRVAELLDAPSRLERMRRKAVEMGRPNAAREIAIDALRIAGIEALVESKGSAVIAPRATSAAARFG